MTLFQADHTHAIPPVNSPGAIVGLGEMLSAARVAAGLDVADVAEQTNIQPYHLVTLEADQELPLAKTFILGYLRSIARVLDCDAEPWLGCVQEHYTALEAVAMEEPPATAVKPHNGSGAKATSKRQSGHFRMGSSWAKAQVNKIAPAGLYRSATLAAVPMIALSVLAFTVHTIDGKFETLLKPAQPIGRNATDQLGPLANQVLLSEEEKSTSALTNAVADANSAARVSRHMGTGAQNEARLLTASSNPVRITVPLQNEKLAGERVEQPVREPVPYAAPEAADMVVLHGMQDRLVIDVYEDSWIDVRDGEGNRLYRDLARAGRRIDVSGELPFALHLGNAPALAMELNGEPVSITGYRADKSARLTLASNQP